MMFHFALNCISFQSLTNKDENNSNPNTVSNAPPYTIASLIGASELGKMGIIFPNLEPGIYQSFKASELNHVEGVKHDVLTENITLDSTNTTQSISHAIAQNAEILEIQEPIQPGNIYQHYFSITTHFLFYILLICTQPNS